ncbi:MAG: hypothetical protein QW625_03515 [Candidatus Nanoarchaeia archaeon]
MELSLKKFIIFLFILLALAAAIYFICFYFFKKIATPEKLGKEIDIQPQKIQRLIPLSQEKALAPTVDEAGKEIKFYSKDNGNLYKVKFDGTNLTKISSANLAGILKILWSPNKESIISYFQEDEKIKKYLHNYQSGQSSLLKEEIEQAVWSPDGTKIVVQSFNPENKTNTISIADANGQNLKPIFQTRIKDLLLEWSTIDKISLKTKPSGLSEGLLLVINPDNGEFHSVLNGIYGLNIKWSPLGNFLIYSATTIEGKKPQLFSIDQNGQNKKTLGLSTIIEKCVFSQDNRTLFCALPKKVSENAVWPDDYYKGLVATADEFYKINLDTGEKDLMFSPDPLDKNYDATDMFLTPEEDYLIFINKRDGLLYSLNLQTE